MDSPLDYGPRCPACGIHTSEHEGGAAPGAINLGVDFVEDCRSLRPVAALVEDFAPDVLAVVNAFYDAEIREPGRTDPATIIAVARIGIAASRDRAETPRRFRDAEHMDALRQLGVGMDVVRGLPDG